MKELPDHRELFPGPSRPRNDAALAARNEREHVRHRTRLFNFLFYSLHCLRDIESRLVEKTIGVIQGRNGFFIETSSPKPDKIEAFELQRFLPCQNVRRNVFANAETSSNHRMLTDMHKLMDGCEPADDHPIPKDNMPAECNTISENDIVSKLTIVRHMRVRHEQAVLSDAGDPAYCSGPIQGHEFAHNRIVSNFKVRFFSRILQVLRRPGDGCAVEDLELPADARTAADGNAGTDPRPIANDNIIFND